eukprot:gene48694-21966_t
MVWDLPPGGRAAFVRDVVDDWPDAALEQLVAGFVDAADAAACEPYTEWERWRAGAASGAARWDPLADPLTLGPAFCSFLAHPALVPASFLRECVRHDLDRAMHRGDSADDGTDTD